MPGFRCLFEPVKSRAKTSSSLPGWEDLVAGTGGHFCLMAFSGWLSLLRLGLLSTGADGAEELYAEIFAAYEGAVTADLSSAESNKSTAMYSKNYPHTSYLLRLHVAHTGGELFEAHLERQGSWTYWKPIGSKRSSTKAARQDLPRRPQSNPSSSGSRKSAALIFDELARQLPAGAQGV